MCGYSVVASPLRHGALITLLASLVVATGVMVLLGLVLERRWLRPREMSLAFTIGDPALAVGIAAGAHITGSHQPCGAIGPSGQLIASALWLIFGLWQWRAEVTAGIYTRRQALSPTKIWHQVVVYPLLGAWTFVAVIGGLMNAGRNPAAAAVMVASLAIWAGTLAHNIRHPRLGHPPYDWAHLRPVPPPWGESSTTLRSTAGPAHR
jgi:hypothetical protein